MLFDAKTVWSARGGASQRFGSNFQISPNGKFVAFDDWLHAEPITILNLENGEQKRIRAPQEVEESSHYYQYPFAVKGWSDDSMNLIVEVAGYRAESGPQGGSGEYREAWLIDRETGSARRKK
ncbi:MAG: hypothetical protein NTX87_01470 [Planctomycetota bacterium]|nr:hypothetical protein [Planctomycetota bacterium]